ncbi:hypothetical protein [Aneurinibacillus migulanus]|uniref:Uncharacterized protein n=1 Tax=Aneurinibacillus migulanus TaxID=47500 RepID=A0A0D1XSK8_ANEMI|nr:hypothetical protein [Aneurinibacillus migulanus]KIV50087.1 hypothetical protein TS65_29985 [Aneurinibacillus migulanus]KON95249.1 hypothetical protein AF333_06905 [Aneurinibacillus migulanus]MED0895748.1 hypothetical protein [Aneurinibacillus migulanus]MED1619254.1 hypothetical protein [Aneurinibacillus migulanus]SDK33433.1 hypothetical protein SAMN04487909_14942 [Aneurinibacillus migulanus]
MAGYIPIRFKDTIKDPITGDIIERGTPLNQVNLDHVEDGILSAHEKLELMELEMARMKVYMEIDGRVTGGKGTFFETMDGVEPHLMRRETAEAMLPVPVNASSEPITLSVFMIDDSFTSGEEVTIYDDEGWEEVVIQAVEGNKLTLNHLQNNYKKGAIISRSPSKPDPATKTMKPGVFKTYDLSFREV